MKQRGHGVEAYANRRKYLALRGLYDALPRVSLDDLERIEKANAHDTVSSREWRMILSLGLEELTEKQRRVIELVAFEGLNIREASERVTESWINGRDRYYRGLEKLKDFVQRRRPMLSP
jgi:DNA-directed RNA polymerase specialized sigma24 family protein